MNIVSMFYIVDEADLWHELQRFEDSFGWTWCGLQFDGRTIYQSYRRGPSQTPNCIACTIRMFEEARWHGLWKATS